MMPYEKMLHYPYPRYDELEVLRAELDQEDRVRESLEYSNGELERSIAELEQFAHELEENTRGVDDNEWKVRYESQVAMNKQLSEMKDWLETELAEARRKLTTGSYPEAMNFNLDALTEAELLRLVKHLERMRNDFYSTLRDTEWKLDKESKEFHHFDEMRRVYKGDLKHAVSTIERMRLSVMDPSGVISPLYGYSRWLDTQTPGGSKGAGGSKSPSRNKPGGSKSTAGNKDNRSPSRSPTRSKSRNEKKVKKKEPPPPPPPEEETPKSETENENNSEEEEEEPPPPPPSRSPRREPPSHHGSPKKKQDSTENSNTSIKDSGKDHDRHDHSPSRSKRETSKDRNSNE